MIILCQQNFGPMLHSGIIIGTIFRIFRIINRGDPEHIVGFEFIENGYGTCDLSTTTCQLLWNLTMFVYAIEECLNVFIVHL